MEEELKKAPTDPSIKPADVQLKLLTAKDDLDKANQKLAAAIAAADADANANTDPVLSPPAAAPVPVPVPVPDAANAGNPVASLLGAAWQNLVGKPDQDAVQAAPRTINAAAAARARAGNAANTGMTEEQREAARIALTKRLAANTIAREKNAAVLEGELRTGGKRRTRRHKKRAGTRRYKKRAGTRRHKKRSGTHKKRKNRTR